MSTIDKRSTAVMRRQATLQSEGLTALRVVHVSEGGGGDPATANAMVTGAGDPDSWGLYIRIGENEGHGVYVYDSPTTTWTMMVMGGEWGLYNAEYSAGYGGMLADYPWDAYWNDSWFPGPMPKPVVTMAA